MQFEVTTGTLVGGFRVVSLLGEGAMGRVYLADDLERGEGAALKLLVPELARLMPLLRRHLANVLRAGETAELLATVTDSGIDLALSLKRKREADLLMGLSALASALKLARLSWNGEDVAIAEIPSLRVGRFTVALVEVSVMP